MIRYKAKGRPSKDAKDKVKRINEIIAEMPNSSASQYEKEVKNIDEIDDILSSLSSKKEKQEVENYINNCFGFQRKQKIAQKITGQIAAYLRENPHQADETIELISDLFQLESEKLPQR